MCPVRRLLTLAAVAALLAGVAGAPPSTAAVGAEFDTATPVQTPGLPNLDAIDPVRFGYDDAIIEHFQVPTRKNPPTCQPAVSIATCPDTIWVDVIRPNTEAVKVPTIMMSSPYFNTLGRGYKAQCKTPHQSPPGGLPGSPGAPGLSNCASSQTPFPEWYDEYFVPRGYAFAAMDLRGTRNSSGCQQYGDRDEVIDAVDVIDYLAEQPWSNGKVGMTGGSYDGTIANGAAAEAPITGRHPEALSAIIPIRSIGAWYDYHFFNGVQSAGHAATPALFTAALAAVDLPNSGTDDPLYAFHLAERKACIATLGAVTDVGYAKPYQDADDAFWSERDFLKDAGGFRAATFVIHGLYDFNVKPHNAGYLWSSLPETLPKRLLLLNTDHTDPRCDTTEACAASGHDMPVPLPDKFVELNHRWWLQFLKGVEAGATRTAVEVQQANGKFAASPTYPVTGTKQVLALTTEGTLSPELGGDEGGEVAYADGPASQGAPARVHFVGTPFAKDTRVSGMLDFNLTVSTLGPDTGIAVTVADLGPDVPADEASAEASLQPDDSGALTVTYGWLRAFYRDTVQAGPQRNVPSGGAPMTPNTPTPVSFSSMHMDYVFKAGHRLRVSFDNSAGGIVPSLTGQVVTLSTGAGTSTVTVPIAGRVAQAPTRPGPARPAPSAPAAPKPPQPAPLPATGNGLPPAMLVVTATLGIAVGVARRLRDRTA
ncbi:MAG TPA: CocE/NonD family hydrolase [Mycobacteriales bacterium]|nr:CocE/NonD family hydrolase [Mycobacteriales bacterium]